jgi:pyochelin biosynthesis protein PchC
MKSFPSTGPRRMPPHRWLRTFRGVERGATSLICFPHAGGSASFYSSWRNHLLPDADVIAIQYPGHEDRLSEPFIPTMDRLVDLISEALASTFAGKFALFGHSMGAAVAYEVAVRLEALGLIPSALFVSAHPAPHLQRNRAPPGSDEAFRAEIERLSGPLAAPPDEDVFREVFLPAIRNDYELIFRYSRPLPAIIGAPIVALVAGDDCEASVPEMEGWAKATEGGFRIERFEGGHFYLVDHPEQVANVIVEILRNSYSQHA